MSSSKAAARPSRPSSLLKSASSRFSDIGKPRSKKERVTDSKTKDKIRISPPFNFKNLSDDTSSSTSMVTEPAKASALSNQYRPESRNCVSPLDKPLPSLPVATIITKSPVKAKRSLIDAQEKPLRRSVSPKQQTFEDWPALSPQKQRDPNSTAPTPTKIKPSISEGLAERMRQLNIAEYVDGKQDLTQDIPTETTLLEHHTTSTRDTHSRPTSSNRSSIPVIRQTKTSELRLRLSASNLEELKGKKTTIPSPLGNISGNVTTRARGVKRSADTRRGHSRSRSRHRVTAQGSPYTSKEDRGNEADSGRQTSMNLDSSKIETDFTNSLKKSGSGADVKQHEKLHDDRRTSIPVPKRLVQVKADEINHVGLLGSPLQSSPTLKNDVPNIVSAFNYRDRKASSLISSISGTVEDVTTKDYEHSDSHSNTVFDDMAKDFDFGLEESQISTNRHSLSSEHFSPNAVGTDSPLMPSLRADEVAHEIQSRMEAVNSNVEGLTTITPPDSRYSDLSEPENPSNVHDGTYQNSEGVARNDTVSEDHNAPRSAYVQFRQAALQSSDDKSISRKPVPHDDGMDNKRKSLNSATWFAPPVKPGTPVDDSYSTAWPFRESVVAPFKTITIPQHPQNRAILDLTPNAKGQTNNDAGGAVKENEVPEKFIREATLDNTGGNLDPTSVPDQHSSEFPMRSSSRHNNSSRTTGFRTPSARVPTLTFNDTPVARNHPSSAPKLGFHHLHTNSYVTRQNRSRPPPSPVPVINSVSTGKGVIKNIKGLFHKGSNLHASIHGSLHDPLRRKKSTLLARRPPISPANVEQSILFHTPCQPQTGNPLPHSAKTEAKSTPRTFPTNRIVRPFASSSPVPEDTPGPSSTTSRTEKQVAHKQPTHDPPNTPSTEPIEIQDATKLVYHLLEIIEQDDIHGLKQKQMVELASLLVSLLSSARDAEKALQQAKIAAANCEMKCLEVRREVGRIKELVERLLD